MSKTFRQKFIGDRAFYRMLILLVTPIVIQNGITNFVSLLDNVMVGKLGTCQMSAVSVVNQLLFVFNISLFGGLSGASIFGAQFYGKGDYEGMRSTFRFRILFAVAVTAVSLAVFAAFGEGLVLKFLDTETNTPETIAITLAEAKSYFRIAVFGMLPFAIVQVYAGTMRECGETMAPMTAGIIAITVNLVFNWLLIYGKLGFPALGVAGAALATVLSRFVELAYIVISTHRHTDRFRFAVGAYRSFRIPGQLVRKIAVTGSPLFINEFLWSLGMTFISQNYSTRGISVIAAINITSTVWNLFCVIMFGMGSAVSILVGQRLGAGDAEGAVDVDNKLIFFTFVSHVAVGILLIAASPFIPLLYNVEPEVRSLAVKCLMIAGGSAPIHALAHVFYFTLRSGGKTIITFIFDAGYTWVVPAMLTLFLCKYTTLGIVTIYFIVQFSDTIKLIVGYPMLKSRIWVNCLVKNE